MPLKTRLERGARRPLPAAGSSPAPVEQLTAPEDHPRRKARSRKQPFLPTPQRVPPAPIECPPSSTMCMGVS